jgi:hypothetical protein
MPQQFTEVALMHASLDHDVGEYRTQSHAARQLAQSIIIGQLIGDRHEAADARKQVSTYGNRSAEGE